MPLLALLLLGLSAPSAHAACTLTPSAPSAGASLSSAPVFQWSQGGCNAVSLYVSPRTSGRAVWTSLTTVSGNGGKSYALSAGDWSTLSTGAWSSGMCWRLVGRSVPATLTYGPTICVDVQPDADGDGYTEEGGDCDDTNASINPGAVEQCDGWMDDDCDGWVGEYDMDGDGWTICAGDCDDDDYATQPDPYWEVCNGVDDDCDGAVDEDFDGDGYGVCDDCEDYPGYESVYPGAPEVLGNNIDDDCDGAIDETSGVPYDPSSSAY